MKRRQAREIRMGQIRIGGGLPPVIQTMITTPLIDPQAALTEALEAYNAGCPIVRTAVKNESELICLSQLTKDFPGELIADIHFNYKLALGAIACGVSGIRFNPGNIGGKERVKEVIEAAKQRPNLAVRIGVNGGSLEKDILEKYGEPNAAALAESSGRWAGYLEKELNYYNFKISVKSSSVPETIEACRLTAQFTDAPFHVGITEAGGGMQGRIKSAVGIGVLFYEGLVDTFRVSLTAPVVEEIKTGMHILKACGLLERGGEIVSCPTCGRTHGAMFDYYNRLERFFDEHQWWLKPKLKVAVMGCEVNGPGEAREADFGIALGNDSALLFKNGEIIEKFTNQNNAFETLLNMICEQWNIR